MEDDLKRAKEILARDPRLTCVFVCGDTVVTSTKRGVRPLLDLFEDGTDYAAFSAADKVIGKGAAFLYVLLGIGTVYTRVVSEPAKAVLDAYDVSVEADELVPMIQNHDLTGFCPIEQSVLDIDEPAFALPAIRARLRELAAAGQGNAFPKTGTFDTEVVREKIMGPNPLKICEELLRGAEIPRGSRVLDLGSGTGITSVMLAREYGFEAFAVDLWSDPEENRAFFAEMGLTDEQIHPIHADATEGLPFEPELFDAVVSIDSYNYYGRDSKYLGTKLLPYVKPGAPLYLAIPGMRRDCHDDLPACLLASWSPEQLDYMHDMDWWRAMLSQTSDADILDMHELTCTREAWDDWLTCENEYAQGDRAAIEAGGLDYLSTIAIVLRKK